MKIKDAVRTLLFKDKVRTYNQLYTEWGEKLDYEHVLEEYPRPQLKRESYTILNGYWDYSITKEDSKPEVFDGRILVPFSPESVLSGVNRQLKPGEYLWYQRKLEVLKKSNDNRCILHFGAVDQFCEVFVNDHKVTDHCGGYLPFSADITEQIILGINFISLRVTDISDTSYHSRGKQKLERGGMFYTAQSGIWQTVWLEWVPKKYIRAIKLTPMVDESVIHIDIFMNEPVEAYEIRIIDRGKTLYTIGSKFPSIEIVMKDFELWSPENPFLYDLAISAGEDRIVSYFAMRKIEIKEDKEGIKRIFLNNRPYFQNGLLDQGYWPDGLYTAPSDEALIFDILQAKKLGFNMLRKHIKIESLRWYYHCDRLGMLVWQDMINGGEQYNMLLVGYLPTLFPKLAEHVKDKHYKWLGRGKAEGREEWIKECRETVELLYNHPSIVVWVPFNEGWGQFEAVKAYELIMGMDFTRLIDHASGWFDQKHGDFTSIHNYFHKLKVKPGKRAVVLSEYGGFACYMIQHSYSLKIYGYRIFLTRQALNDAYQKLFHEEIEALKKKGLSAAVYTQLSDVEDEVNGLFTYDRKVLKVESLNKDMSTYE